LLTYSIEQSPSWGANPYSTSQEIPGILWNPNVHDRVYKCPLHAPVGQKRLLRGIFGPYEGGCKRRMRKTT